MVADTIPVPVMRRRLPDSEVLRRDILANREIDTISEETRRRLDEELTRIIDLHIKNYKKGLKVNHFNDELFVIEKEEE